MVAPDLFKCNKSILLQFLSTPAIMFNLKNKIK